ncbi:chromate resistance protein ChrB domain-containing protein [Ideonella sp.]|uniref:chromate resistance protein ChrB domain-containing protein n=1 Tax=Ideonella sp. TaxID=1929293 RepID=UPI0035AFCA09
MTDWLVLAATLPTHPSALRVRVWRALKATGAGTLRDGVYLLPAHAPGAAVLRELAATVTGHGATAHLLSVQPVDAAQDTVFRSLVDRTDAYAVLHQALRDARQQLPELGATEARRLWRTLSRQVAELRAIDFFPGHAAAKADAGLEALQQEIDRRHSPGEPTGEPATPMPRLARADHQGRRWATRRRPWVDRLATAWLIQRRVDPEARFLWLDRPADCPPDALGFDFDGARFTHVGERVSFEVVAASFGLADEPAIARLGAIVRCLDTGAGAPQDEAAGVELMVRGLHARHADDDTLLAAALPLFDTLHAALEPPR